VLRPALSAACVTLCTLALASCGGEGAASPAPLPSLSSAERPSSRPTGDQDWAGLTGHDEIRFGTGPGDDAVLRVVGCRWGRSVQAADGSAHENVLAVALRVTCPSGADEPLRLCASGRLRLSDGRSRRSGKFPVAGRLKAVKPGTTAQGWLVFDDVDRRVKSDESPCLRCRLR
jgi:hypothetical protein